MATTTKQNQLSDFEVMDNQREAIHSYLRDIGAPKLPKDDIAKLGNGTMGDILLFLRDHLKGRVVTQYTRRAIASNSSLDTSNDRACGLKKVRSTMNDLDYLRRQIEHNQRAIKDNENTINDIRSKLRSVQRLSLLLTVLHNKEFTRVQRLSELSHLLLDTCITYSGSNVPKILEESSTAVEPTKTPLYADRTRDALAMFQAYHLQVLKAASSKTLHRIPEAETRLRNAIAKNLGVLEDDPQVQAKLQNITLNVRRRAETKLHSHQTSQTHVNTSLLESTSARMAQKETNLRRTLEQIDALVLSATECMQAISIHCEATVPTLNESLDDDLQKARGYLGVLRSSIEAATSTHPSDMASGRQPDKVRHNILEAHEIQNCLLSAQIVERTVAPAVHAIIGSFTATEAAVNKKAIELLTRKNAKKESVGDVLVGEIERLRKEVEILVNGTL
ncbi:hypothetical protein BXZ70DRAFT_705709 [Cristinia sonorae]|uniref:Uncharacterized protein n=1 Tax=Cristinia sonorae TaxID=1940300 RepID=A0A8K0XJQ9_9AGAR|nr:hypothetical protein BXZ70DRAFT_705709 [Cristinia sonorae]